MATAEPQKMEAADTTVALDDDKPPQQEEFVGATLQIDSETRNTQPEPQEAENPGPGLTRDRPGSVIGRQSVRSTSSRTSMRPGITKSDVAAKTYFSYKVPVLF